MNKFLAGLSLIVGIGLWQGGFKQEAAQTTVDANKPSVAAVTKPQETAKIRATTRLVQVSVVVTDKKDEPVTGLTKDDFTVLDEANPQQIAFFTEAAPPPASAAATPLLPKNVFTNRYDLKGQDPGAVTIILFDAENTATEDQFYVRKQVMALLRSLKSQDHVAIYGLTTQLLILHDFTQDDSALVEAVNKFEPRQIIAFDSSFATKVSFPNQSGNIQWKGLSDALETPNGQMANAF